jgi:polyribonucleotide nucleotidyltransferase
VTFDSPESAAQADLISMILGSQKYKRFMIHYEFHPFSINETGSFLMPGRREIGHGALAERAFLPVLPPQFPFTIRVTSQVLDSNGSSSMATVCGASLALHDAGVPISRPVAGVACGLVTRKDEDTQEILDYKILTDISGVEDAQGNMDFKVAGTSVGITSLQIDIKNIPGIPYHVFKEAIMKSRDARLSVLSIMNDCQASPRLELKKNGPAYATIEVPPEKRRKLIGSGGHRIQSLVSETGAEVHTVSDEQMSVFAPTSEAMEDLMERIEAILQEEDENEEFEVGAIYPAIVRDVRDYGLIVELAPGVQLLLHKSQISHKIISHPSELGLVVGQTINVKYYGRDPVTGRHYISRKSIMTPPVGAGSENVMQTIRNSGRNSHPGKSK